MEEELDLEEESGDSQPAASGGKRKTSSAPTDQELLAFISAMPPAARQAFLAQQGSPEASRSAKSRSARERGQEASSSLAPSAGHDRDIAMGD